MIPLGIAEWKGAKYIRKKMGEMGEPWGVPTSTGALMPRGPWKTRVQERSERKDMTQSTMYERMFFATRRALSLNALTLWKPALMLRKRVDTSHLRHWRVQTLWIKVAHGSEMLSRGRVPHWLGWRGLGVRALEESLKVMTLSSILEIVVRRTMIRKEEGIS